MKKLLLILLCLPMIGFGQTLIPDANFEQALINLGYDTGTPNGSVSTANINTVTDLDVSNQFISDLTGIEDFTALTYLNCSKNNLSSLDLSTNLLLFSLDAAENQLAFLNVSNNINLKGLGCEDNQLTSLDISNNTNLEELGCDYNQLTSLDVSNNINLDNLFCSQNNITELDLSQCLVLEKLECLSNQLVCLNLKNGSWDASVDATNNPQLNCVEVDSIGFFNSDPFNYLNFDVNVSFNTSCNNNCSTTSIQEQTTNKELLKVTDLLGRETNQINQPLFYIYDDGTVEKKIVIE
jgi:Leucine-rich repeat (LRR) protein